MPKNHSSIKLVECHGAPREMGRQYGEQAGAAIRQNIKCLTAETARDIAQ